MSEKKKLPKPSNPQLMRVTAYIQPSTYQSMRETLALDRKDFSTLIEQLLRIWLQLRRAAKATAKRERWKSAIAVAVSTARDALDLAHPTSPEKMELSARFLAAWAEVHVRTVRRR